MTTKLSNVIVKEVAIVPAGANAKKIHLRKAAETEVEVNEELQKAQADAKTAAEALEKAQADQAALAAKVEALEKAATEAATAAAAEKAALEKAAVDSAAKTVELEKRLNDEREAKEISESIQKAAADFKNLPEKAEDLGPMLRAIRKADPAVADKVESLLKKVDAISKGALESKGSSVGGEAAATAIEEIQKRADLLVKEGKAKTGAEAFEAVLKADPNLYTQYQREKNSAR